MPMYGWYGAGTVRCRCGKEARVMVTGAGSYVRCPYCNSSTYMCTTKEDAVRMFQEQYGLTGTGDAAGTEVLAFAQYPDLEKAADRTAAKIKEGFMEMGYILKVARDTDILKGSGYGSHEEFAEKRYGLDKGTVSRYIRIVERFSVGGNSHVLQEGYKNIGFAKLSLMLHMPDAIAEEITESYSKQEVQAIKDEIDAERAVSDIEVAIEDAGIPEEKKAGSLLDRALRQLGKEQQGIYRKLYDACRKEGEALPRILDALAPQGEAIYMVRIPGTGRLMLSVTGESASVTNVRSGDKEKYALEDIRGAVTGILHGSSAAESWQQEYGEPPEPEKEGSPERAEKEPDEKAAPVQAKEKRKEPKVTKATPPKQPEKKVSSVTEEVHPEKPLPGQMEVLDYPEAIPDAHFEEIKEDVPAEGTSGPVAAGTEELLSGEYSGTEHAESPERGDLQADSRIMGMESAEKEAAGTGIPETGDAAESSDMPELAESAEDIRTDANGCLERLGKTFTIWDREIPPAFLKTAHQDAVDLAAAIEKLMDLAADAEKLKDAIRDAGRSGRF